MRRLIIIGLLTVAAATAATALAGPFGPSAPASPSLSAKLAQARVATAKYATDLGRAKADGYQILTRMIPSMGFHYINPKVTGFDIRKPPILVYVKHGSTWQLGAFEWVFPKRPARPPIQGARYGSFGAACHYVDGTFVFAASQDMCAATSPQTGAKLNFWHPDLVTLHVWLWYPNPDGLYAGMNPLVTPFNRVAQASMPDMHAGHAHNADGRVQPGSSTGSSSADYQGYTTAGPPTR
jgi:hypothetical protein